MSGISARHAAWLAKADNDVLNIQNNLAASRVPWDTVCFHAQQAAEKTMKALLAFHQQPLHPTHDLVALLNACAAIEPSLSALLADCQRLTYYAVAVRYPDALFEPSESDGRAMIEAMERVRAQVLPLFASAPP